MTNDHCDECEGKTGGHKPYCSKRFDGSSADPYSHNLAPTERDMVLQSSVKKNTSTRILMVAVIVCLAAGILWQIFGQ